RLTEQVSHALRVAHPSSPCCYGCAPYYPGVHALLQVKSHLVSLCATVLSCTVAAADQSATALQLSVHNGQYSHWRWFLYHSAVPPDHYHRYCRATATEVASTREPDIVRLISSYCVLQLVRDHPLLKCTYLYRCTTTGLTGFKNQPPEWFLLPEKPVK